jgi:SAM-dependent methyltransferase
MSRTLENRGVLRKVSYAVVGRWFSVRRRWEASAVPFDHNDHYHRLLLRHVPAGCRTALDVGCGTGRFARRLAARGVAVDGVDASAQVVAVAREASADDENPPRFRQSDIARTQLPSGHYDFVSCLASIHHMPLAPALTALREALAPGGTLVVLGCYAQRTPVDHAWSAAAVPVNAAARLAAAARERLAGGPSAHGAVRAPVRQPVTPLTEIRREAAALLPGATVRRLLFWRYLLLYRK